MKSRSLPGTSRYPTPALLKACAALLPLILCFSGPAKAQCPFEPEDAVADTLDPLGYYPLATGNVWEFEMYDGAFPGDLRREEILSYHGEGDTIFFNVRVTRFERVGVNTFDKRPPTESPSRIVLSQEVWIGGLTPDGWQNTVRLDAPFNSCFFSSDTQDSIAVTGEFDYWLSIDNDQLMVPARKDFNRQFWGEGYAHGVGPIGGWGDPNVRTSLIYARIDDEEYGVPIEERDITIVSARDGYEFPTSTDLRAEIFPNPFDSKLRLVVYAARSEAIAIELFDLVGRSIAVPAEHTPAHSGRHFVELDTESLAPGLYAIRITTGIQHSLLRVVLKN